ncbi:MAG: glycogen phosphorylase [Lentisphaerae bacterium GWF2_57_35]|nr:MAG: glycogen phosphorylase [Lentisphaerae bacterium GWF2_57_35]
MNNKQRIRTKAVTAANILKRVDFHLKYSRCKDMRTATEYDKLNSLSHAVRDFAVDKMIATQREYLDRDVKRVYYLSMEFLIGRLLSSNMLSLGIMDATLEAVKQLGLNFDRLCCEEPDAGLGNGGLGRLAACYLDSMASLEYPGYGYGIRYEHGIFVQEFTDGWQVERPDDWLDFGSPWEMIRPEYKVPVLVYGRLENVSDGKGGTKSVWVDWQMFEGVPYDLPVIGFGVDNVNILRLWSSRAAEGFRLDVFNQGEYTKAVEEKNWAETVTKVLYPSENTHAGKALRLIQEYFLVACTVRDIVRRYRKNHLDFDDFAEKNAIQMNDTHPALTVAELMRYFVDEADMPWDAAWTIVQRTLGYTNHTLLPEALEKWPVPLLERVLPRHLQIIYEINQRFLREVIELYPGDGDRVRRMSLIEEGDTKFVRMANLAMVGSHAVNGVAKLHTELLKKNVVPDFAHMWPDRFVNITNGVTQRRWLLQCNPGLAELITEAIGDGWITDLGELHKLEKQARNKAFCRKFMNVKQSNKNRLAELILEKTGLEVNPKSLFDVQIKRLHEYKRQLLNAMHIVTLYRRLKAQPSLEIVPRTFIFGAKAAPGYHIAKVIIKFINTLSEAIDRDPVVKGRLKVVFLPDYNVSLAEQIVPAADLSEQISTAGKEASGTGNMKLALNGALTIGTWDGANIEIAEEVGLDHIFIFGLHSENIERMRTSGHYSPWDFYQRDDELRGVVNAIRDNEFMFDQKDLFGDIYRLLTEWGDYYLHLADYRSYVDAQERVSQLYEQPDLWAEKAVLNVARMGYFSSDRAVRDYAQKIWAVKPLHIRMNGHPLDELD